jgi:hypothetical protein
MKGVQNYAKCSHQVTKYHRLECVSTFEYSVDRFYHHLAVLDTELLHKVVVIFVQLGGITLASTENFTDHVLNKF